MSGDPEVNFSPKRRREVIERAISKQVWEGTYAGIFGAEPCQVCGNLGTFSGWASAMATHMGGAFVCWPCRKQLGDDVRAALKANPVRYCFYCLASQPAEDCIREGSRWVCKACHETKPDGVSRRRYVEMTCDTDEKLAALDLQLEMAALNLEETVSPELAQRRRERAARRLEETGKAHGVDYFKRSRKRG